MRKKSGEKVRNEVECIGFEFLVELGGEYK
jgi:hypothetical protein